MGEFKPAWVRRTLAAGTLTAVVMVGAYYNKGHSDGETKARQTCAAELLTPDTTYLGGIALSDVELGYLAGIETMREKHLGTSMNDATASTPLSEGVNDKLDQLSEIITGYRGLVSVRLTPHSIGNSVRVSSNVKVQVSNDINSTSNTDVLVPTMGSIEDPHNQTIAANIFIAGGAIGNLLPANAHLDAPELPSTFLAPNVSGVDVSVLGQRTC